MDRWIALFSQTGSEIVEVAESIGVWPSSIYTNNLNTELYHSTIRNKKIAVMSHAGIEETLGYAEDMSGNTIITLHGYLRVLSPKITNTSLQIYNGHPAYISKYPELKGKDPQEKTWYNKEKYTMIGSTIHKVVAEVDSGNIIEEVIVENTCNSKEDMYNKLRATSIEAWINFLRGKLKYANNE